MPASLANLSVQRTQAYTPTFTGFGTAASVNFTYTQLGNLLIIQGKFTTGTCTAVEARVSLPSGYTSASTLPTLTGVGTWGGYSAVSGSTAVVLVEPSVTYMTFGVQDSSHSGLSKVLGTGLISNASSMSITAIIPIQG
jgi:hypothetical protein